ncbi:MAG: biotin--[acetyl-CoA-carboxylase] ligase [Gemmatimonadetes bacterium]|nr:biotin--[acetyl-CoA-carboxylase] ligase [Gemmatimonadota bacterium]
MTWLGLDGVTLAARLGLPRVEAVGVLGSTMDAAHELAAGGAPAGTLVVAEEQSAGRGRGGRVWTSGPGAGLWMTLVERPRSADGIDVLSLRVGLRLAPVLERWTVAPIRLKWPNDLYVDRRKLAGVLIEARWRGAHPDWVAIGLGLNLVAPPDLAAAALLGARAETVLAEVVPALRAAAFAHGPLSTGELAEFARRDLAMGQRVSSPAEGLVRGISSAGELLVETDSGITPHRAGSLVFAIS